MATTPDDSPAGDPTPEPPHTFPWPPQPAVSPHTAFVETWMGATFRPRNFFAAMPREGGYGAAILYYLILAIVAAAIELFWGTVLDRPSRDLPMLGMTGETFSPLVTFLLTPIISLIALIVSAGVTHAILAVIGGARGRFTTTARVFAYAYSPQLFVVLPTWGIVIGFVWMIGLAIVGLREAHPTEGWRAAVAVLVPVMLALAWVTLLVVASSAIMFG